MNRGSMTEEVRLTVEHLDDRDEAGRDFLGTLALSPEE